MNEYGISLGAVLTPSTFRLFDAEWVHGVKCACSWGTIYDQRGPILAEMDGLGGPLVAGDHLFRDMTTITDRRLPRGRVMSVLLPGCLMDKTEKNNKVSFDMTYSYDF